MNSLCHKREGGRGGEGRIEEGRGGEWRGGEGRGGRREGERREGMEGGRGGMTVIHIILMAPYIQTNNEELYLYNNDVTYYVITCKSAFEYNNDVTYYVITCNSIGYTPNNGT